MADPCFSTAVRKRSSHSTWPAQHVVVKRSTIEFRNVGLFCVAESWNIPSQAPVRTLATRLLSHLAQGSRSLLEPPSPPAQSQSQSQSQSESQPQSPAYSRVESEFQAPLPSLEDWGALHTTQYCKEQASLLSYKTTFSSSQDTSGTGTGTGTEISTTQPEAHPGSGIPAETQPLSHSVPQVSGGAQKEISAVEAIITDRVLVVSFAGDCLAVLGYTDKEDPGRVKATKLTPGWVPPFRIPKATSDAEGEGQKTKRSQGQKGTGQGQGKCSWLRSLGLPFALFKAKGRPSESKEADALEARAKDLKAVLDKFGPHITMVPLREELRVLILATSRVARAFDDKISDNEGIDALVSWALDTPPGMTPADNIMNAPELRGCKDVDLGVVVITFPYSASPGGVPTPTITSQ